MCMFRQKYNSILLNSTCMIVDLKSYYPDFLWFAIHDTVGAMSMCLWHYNEFSEKDKKLIMSNNKCDRCDRNRWDRGCRVKGSRILRNFSVPRKSDFRFRNGIASSTSWNRVMRISWPIDLAPGHVAWQLCDRYYQNFRLYRLDNYLSFCINVINKILL